jgi:U3 small nucleolar RNA-associated protein 10
LLIKQHLLSPYIGILLPHIEELLPAFANGSIQDEALWTLLLEVLAKSYEVDDGGKSTPARLSTRTDNQAFWTDQHHIKMIPPLTAQLPLFPNVQTSPVATACASLAGSTTSTPVLKSLNNSLCLATRSDSSVVRMSALKCIDGVWDKQPDEMIQFVPETVSEFLSELLEDENSDVENMARKVLARIEGLTGSLKEYLE